MSGKLPLVLVASLALVSVVAAHSVEKRQTTVNSVISPLFRGLEGAVSRKIELPSCYETFGNSGCYLLGLMLYAYVLLPKLIPEVIKLIPEYIFTGQDLTPIFFAIFLIPTLFPIILIGFLIIYLLAVFGITIPGAGKRSYEDITWLPGVRNMFYSLDIVETGFRYMDIEDESCRLKTICELESYAVSHPLASLAINTINSNLRGLDRYQTAIQAGINGEDCALIYDQCRVSYVGY